MKSLIVFLCVTYLCACAEAQIKNSGIKTRVYPIGNSSNLILEGNASSSGSDTVAHQNNFPIFDRNTYVPAETYQGGGTWETHGSSVVAHPTRAPVFLDATAEFINKTRSAMASGICYKEVPTASLLRNPTEIPRGNGTNLNMSKIQVCCEGYERNAHVFARCDPICIDDCPNGICTAPNTCVCIPGHVRNYENKCISTCPLGCGNGVCDEQRQCQCKPGYVIEPLKREFCVPHCEHGCQYGKCVAPNKCDCLEGFRLTATGTCEPKCDNCDNGHCTSPGFCSCNIGYERNGNICEPVCKLGCNKGRCVAPDVCECSRGFELDRSGTNCVPHCDQPCLNGVCDGDNSCACNTGYIQDEYQRNICKPHCPQGCPNGYCTSPNFCVCKPGFIKSGVKGRQTCMPV